MASKTSTGLTYEPYTSPSGFRWWLFSDGSILPRVAGGDGEGEGGEGEGGEGEGGEGGQVPLTQEQISRIMAREKRQGKDSATRELLEKFGFESVEAAEEAVKKWRKDETDRLSETEKREKEANEAKAQSDKDKAEAARDRRMAKAERKLVAAGVIVYEKDADGNPTNSVDEEASDRMLARAMRNLDVDFDKDVSDEDLASAIQDVKSELPTLFGGTTTESEEENNGSGKTVKEVPGGKAPKGGGDKKSNQEKVREQMDRMGFTKPAESTTK